MHVLEACDLTFAAVCSASVNAQLIRRRIEATSPFRTSINCSAWLSAEVICSLQLAVVREP